MFEVLVGMVSESGKDCGRLGMGWRGPEVEELEDEVCGLGVLDLGVRDVLSLVLLLIVHLS